VSKTGLFVNEDLEDLRIPRDEADYCPSMLQYMNGLIVQSGQGAETRTQDHNNFLTIGEELECGEKESEGEEFNGDVLKIVDPVYRPFSYISSLRRKPGERAYFRALRYGKDHMRVIIKKRKN